MGKVFWAAVDGYKNKRIKEQETAVGKIRPIKIPIEAMVPSVKIPIEVQGRGGSGGGPSGIGGAYNISGGKNVEILNKSKGVSLSEKTGKRYIRKRDEDEVDLTTVNLTYALIPRGSRTPFAASNIKWSPSDSSLIYYLIEPELTPPEKDLLNKIKLSLVEKLDVDFTTLRKGEAKDYLRNKFLEMVSLMARDLPPERQKYLMYYIERDFIGLGKIEPIMQDPEIEDVSCDGVGIPIYIYHRNPVIGSIKSNVKFESAEELDVFVNKLAQRCGKTVSIASPLVGASLPDGNRLQATLGTDIARRGSNFTIRKFTESPLTPINLLKFKTMDAKIAAYLWLAVEYGRSILVSGGVATGKTSTLNALSLFIKPDLKIVTIEDTPELRLPHPHWVPQVARQPISQLEGRKVGEVDLFDLLRESLRQRPDYLIVGEVRGREAYVLFQQIATGHASMSTIHADSFERLMDRLTTPPISLPPNLIEALDIIVFIVKIKYGNTYVRRINSIYEVIGYDRQRKLPIINEIYRWDPITDKYKTTGDSVVVKKISDQHGISSGLLQKELKNRTKVIDWMSERNIINYKDVAKIIKLYYARPEQVLDVI
jgi:flagellar protein FlaI